MRTLQVQMQGKVVVARPIRIFMDSQPAIDLLNNPIHHPKSKQILARYHFIRDRVHNEKDLTVEKCSAPQMGADMLTKHASVGVIRYNRKILSIECFSALQFCFVFSAFSFMFRYIRIFH